MGPCIRDYNGPCIRDLKGSCMHRGHKGPSGSKRISAGESWEPEPCFLGVGMGGIGCIRDHPCIRDHSVRFRKQRL